MKSIINLLLSIFFAIAIGVHIYSIMHGDGKPLWWHGIYFATYAACWWLVFSKNKKREWIYFLMAIFPFVTHVYYAYIRIPNLDTEFWICVLTCVMLSLGFIWLRYQSNQMVSQQQ